MAITITETAATRVKTFLDNRGSGVGLRVGVKTTGCSGMAYIIEFADNIKKEDTVFEEKDHTYIDGNLIWKKDKKDWT